MVQTGFFGHGFHSRLVKTLQNTAMHTDVNTLSAFLPPDDAQRVILHNEVHARPSARVRLPALLIDVAVLHQGVTREMVCAHLSQLPGYADLSPVCLQDNFLHLRCGGYTVKWERHSEFSRYTVVQPLPEQAYLGACEPDLMPHVATPPDWLRQIPGNTVSAVQLVMLHASLEDAKDLMARATH